MLKTKIKLTQSKKAWTQYITIPSAMVQDSQYPFVKNDELYLQIIPNSGLLILSKEGVTIKRDSTGFLISPVSIPKEGA